MTDQIIEFSFICPKDKVEEARKLLSAIPTVTLSPADAPTLLILVSTEADYVPKSGVTIAGTVDEAKKNEVVHALINAKIAGYSKETMVVFPFGKAKTRYI